jgi:hypothetical protein
MKNTKGSVPTQQQAGVVVGQNLQRELEDLKTAFDNLSSDSGDEGERECDTGERDAINGEA